MDHVFPGYALCRSQKLAKLSVNPGTCQFDCFFRIYFWLSVKCWVDRLGRNLIEETNLVTGLFGAP